MVESPQTMPWQNAPGNGGCHFRCFLFDKGEKRTEKSPCHSGTGASFAGVNGEHQTALSTLPERKQRVQAYTRFGVPLTSAFTRLIFGFQVLLERLWEWETLMPKDTSFPQISHLAIYLHLLKVPNSSLQR